jgi:hypothetical protein
MKWLIVLAVLIVAGLTVATIYEPQIKHRFHDTKHTVKTVTSQVPASSVPASP